jgi:hypothetical protein
MPPKSRNFYIKSRRSTVTPRVIPWELALGMHIFRQAERETLKSPQKPRRGGEKLGCRRKKSAGRDIVKMPGEVGPIVSLRRPDDGKTVTMGLPVKTTHSEMLAGGQWRTFQRWGANPLHFHTVTNFAGYLKEQGRKLPFGNPRYGSLHRRMNRKSRRRSALEIKNPVKVYGKACRKYKSKSLKQLQYQPTLFGCVSVSRHGLVFPRVSGYNRNAYKKNHSAIREVKFRVELQEVITHRLRLDKWARTRGLNPVALRLLNKAWSDSHDEHKIVNWIWEKYGLAQAKYLDEAAIIRLPRTPWKRQGARTGSIGIFGFRSLGNGLKPEYGVGKIAAPIKRRYVVSPLRRGMVGFTVKEQRVLDTYRLCGEIKFRPVLLASILIDTDGILAMVPVRLRSRSHLKVFKVK